MLRKLNNGYGGTVMHGCGLCCSGIDNLLKYIGFLCQT